MIGSLRRISACRWLYAKACYAVERPDGFGVQANIDIKCSWLQYLMPLKMLWQLVSVQLLLLPLKSGRRKGKGNWRSSQVPYTVANDPEFHGGSEMFDSTTENSGSFVTVYGPSKRRIKAKVTAVKMQETNAAYWIVQLRPKKLRARRGLNLNSEDRHIAY